MGPDDRIESDLCNMQTFADTLLVKTGCQVSSMISGAKPKLNGKIAGIIDFGDVEEVLENPRRFHGMYQNTQRLTIAGYQSEKCLGAIRSVNKLHVVWKRNHGQRPLPHRICALV